MHNEQDFLTSRHEISLTGTKISGQVGLGSNNNNEVVTSRYLKL